jgi:hypothetical protein
MASRSEISKGAVRESLREKIFMKNRICELFAVVVGLSLVAGCSRGGTPLGRVTGKVTLNGQPLEGAQLTFTAKDAPRAALGTTDAQGVYSLTTFAPNDGAPLGHHTVTITMPAKNAPDMSAGKPDAAYGAAMKQAAKGVQVRGKEIPAKYANPLTSNLSADVKSGNNADVNFDLQP